MKASVEAGVRVKDDSPAQKRWIGEESVRTIHPGATPPPRPRPWLKRIAAAASALLLVGFLALVVEAAVDDEPNPVAATPLMSPSHSGIVRK